MLGAGRPEAAGGCGRGRDRGPGPGRMDLGDPAADQLVADGRRVCLGEDGMDLVVTCGRDPLEDRPRVLVPGLDPFEVQECEPAEPREDPGAPRVDDRVHRGGEHGDRERDAAEVLGQADVVRLHGLRARCERDILEPVGGADRVDLRTEGAPRCRGEGEILVEQLRPPGAPCGGRVAGHSTAWPARARGRSPGSGRARRAR